MMLPKAEYKKSTQMSYPFSHALYSQDTLEMSYHSSHVPEKGIFWSLANLMLFLTTTQDSI